MLLLFASHPSTMARIAQAWLWAERNQDSGHVAGDACSAGALVRPGTAARALPATRQSAQAGLRDWCPNAQAVNLLLVTNDFPPRSGGIQQ